MTFLTELMVTKIKEPRELSVTIHWKVRRPDGLVLWPSSIPMIFEIANVEYIDFWLLNPYLPKYDQSPISRPENWFFRSGTFFWRHFERWYCTIWKRTSYSSRWTLPTINSTLESIQKSTNYQHLWNQRRGSTGSRTGRIEQQTWQFRTTVFANDYLRQFLLRIPESSAYSSVTAGPIQWWLCLLSEQWFSSQQWRFENISAMLCSKAIRRLIPTISFRQLRHLFQIRRTSIW